MVRAFPDRCEERIHNLPGAVVVGGHEVRVGGKDDFLRVAKVGATLARLARLTARQTRRYASARDSRSAVPAPDQRQQPATRPAIRD